MVDYKRLEMPGWSSGKPEYFSPIDLGLIHKHHSLSLTGPVVQLITLKTRVQIPATFLYLESRNHFEIDIVYFVRYFDFFVRKFVKK